MELSRDHIININFTLFPSPESDTTTSSHSSSTSNLQLRGALIMLPFILFVVLANILTILAFLVEKRLHIFCNYFVINMAIADTLVGITAMAPSMVQFLLAFQWPFGHVSCSILMTISHMSFHVSILSVLVICADRWYAVTHPLKHRSVRSRGMALKVNSLIWLMSFVIWGPFTGIWALLDPFSQTAVSCSPVYLRFALGTFGAVVIVYWVPVSMIGVLYISVYRKILTSGGVQVSRNFEKQSKPERESASLSRIDIITISEASTVNSHGTKPGSSSEPQTSQGEMSLQSMIDEKENGKERCGVLSTGSSHDSTANDIKSKQDAANHKIVKNERNSAKAQRTLTFLVVALVVTWTPYACVVLALTYCYTILQTVNCFSPIFPVISVWITWGNSLLNPIMYAAAQPLFRKTMVKLLFGQCNK